MLLSNYEAVKRHYYQYLSCCLPKYYQFIHFDFLCFELSAISFLKFFVSFEHYLEYDSLKLNFQFVGFHLIAHAIPVDWQSLKRYQFRWKLLENFRISNQIFVLSFIILKFIFVYFWSHFDPVLNYDLTKNLFLVNLRLHWEPYSKAGYHF